MQSYFESNNKYLGSTTGFLLEGYCDFANDVEAMFVKTTDLKKVYWKYYLILEKAVLDVEPYVSFHPDNNNCFSNEFIKLYQAICSEIDVICKEYCKYIKDTTSITGKCDNITDYSKYTLTQHPEIVRQTVCLLENSDYELIPWKEWKYDTDDHGNGKGVVTPGWWKKYNDIKHRRADKDATEKFNYQHATLFNVLNALAALYVLEKYFYADFDYFVASAALSMGYWHHRYFLSASVIFSKSITCSLYEYYEVAEPPNLLK